MKIEVNLVCYLWEVKGRQAKPAWRMIQKYNRCTDSIMSWKLVICGRRFCYTKIFSLWFRDNDARKVSGLIWHYSTGLWGLELDNCFLPGLCGFLGDWMRLLWIDVWYPIQTPSRLIPGHVHIIESLVTREYSPTPSSYRQLWPVIDPMISTHSC